MVLEVVFGIGGTLDAGEVCNSETADQIPILFDLEPVKTSLALEKSFKVLLDSLAIDCVGTEVGDVKGAVWRWNRGRPGEGGGDDGWGWRRLDGGVDGRGV